MVEGPEAGIYLIIVDVLRYVIIDHEKMIKRFVNYVDGLYQGIPLYVYIVSVCLFLLGALFTYYMKGRRQGNKDIFLLITIEYIFLIFYVTVFRRPHFDTVKYSFIPFWSFGAIQNGYLNLFPVVVMNVVIFIPIGFFIGYVSRLKWSKVLLIGLCISVTIESLQFLLKRGFSELDDVIHNTLGCLIGVVMLAVIKRIWKFCAYIFLPQRGNMGFMIND